jgi:hypothetical protein
MDTKIRNGEWWIRKDVPDLGVQIVYSGKFIVIFLRDTKLNLLEKGLFLERYKYSHYIPTHQELE